VRFFTVAINTRNLYLWELLRDHVTTTSDLVILAIVAIDAIHPSSCVDIDIARSRKVTVLVIRTAGGREMAARAHLARRSLSGLSGRQGINTFDRNNSHHALLVPGHGARIVWSVADQTVDIVEICFRGR
jgi:hypothetical protein